MYTSLLGEEKHCCGLSSFPGRKASTVLEVFNNNMIVWEADIGDTYLEVTSKEKLYIIAGGTYTCHPQAPIWLEKLRFEMVTENP